MDKLDLLPPNIPSGGSLDEDSIFFNEAQTPSRTRGYNDSGASFNTFTSKEGVYEGVK
jgi:hypothetical protein